MTQAPIQPRRGRVGLTVTLLCTAVVAMGGLAYASVPLYQLFCQVTGFGGTTQVADQGADEILDRTIKVRFNADTASGLPWDFRPAQREVELQVGETGMAYYTAVNNSSRPIVGTASYNVTPLKAGPYFSKIDCFCFTEQELAPGEKVEMPVTFFVDPEIADDKNLDDITTITLSYTFFEMKQEEADAPAEPEKHQSMLRIASLDDPQGDLTDHSAHMGGNHSTTSDNKLGD
jgi:cytochrome c oxidase assembly protein subunit 11